MSKLTRDHWKWNQFVEQCFKHKTEYLVLAWCVLLLPFTSEFIVIVSIHRVELFP